MGSMSAPLYVGGVPTQGMGRPAGGLDFFVNVNTASGARNNDRPWFNKQDSQQTVNSTGGPIVFDDLQEAIDACVADRGDRITVARGYNAVSATVNFNKAGILVQVQNYGMNPFAVGEWATIDSSHTDGPAGRITQQCHIRGLGFKSAQASGDDVTASCILDGSAAADAAFGTWLDGCRFVNWDDASTDHGLYVSSTAGCMISGCAFVGGPTNNLDVGIGMSSSGAWPVTHIIIQGNQFSYCDYAISALQAGGPTTGLIHGNWLLPVGSGKFLNKNNQSSSNVLVSGNWFYTDVSGSTFSHNIADMETAGWWITGNEYSTEA